MAAQPVPDHTFWMRRALALCKDGIDAGQSPFGAVIVRDGRVLGEAHNRVWLDRDATAHAEIVAIRRACRRLGDVHLRGAAIYSTTEPCPMCFTAIHWARIETIVYGATVADAAAFGFNELPVTDRTLKDLGNAAVDLVPEVLRNEALALFRHWRDAGGKTY